MIRCPGGPPLVWKPIPCAFVGGWWCGCGGGSSTASTATDTRGGYHLEEGGGNRQHATWYHIYMHVQFAMSSATGF